MTADEFKALCVPATASLREALAALNQTARGVLLVLHDDGRLRRTITDGDLRRAALSHVSETARIADLPEQPPITLGTDANLPAGVALLDQHQIDHLPIVDASGRPVDVMFRRELSQRIWLSSPHLGDEESAFVEDAFQTNWIAPLGPHVDGFERELAAHVGVATPRP